MKNFSFSTIVLLTGVCLIASCTKNDVAPDPTVGLTKLGTAYATGSSVKAELYTNTTTITTGYNKLWVALYDSATNARLSDAAVMLMPMMDMGTMKHSAPYENPAAGKPANGLYEGAVMFMMPSMGGTWTLDIMVNHKGLNGKAVLPITVNEPAQKRMFMFTSKVDNSSRFLVSLVEPAKPKVGINDLELVVFRRQSMMAFPADSSLMVSFEPEMPTMNHGSPNNVHPAHMRNGHYRGKVNFTMTGLWRLHFNLKQGETLAAMDSLDLTF